MFYFQSVNSLLSGAVMSSIGGRSENQDDFAFADTPLGFAAVVCDGMGGGPGGRTASGIVKREVMSVLCGCNSLMDRASALKMAVSNANEALMKAVSSNPELMGMGSTIVAIIINRQSAVIAHVGDSRCYRLHGGRVKFCTTDHSLVAELVAKKVMTAEQARTSPQSNVITRHIGNHVSNAPQIDEIPFRQSDRFVLCTDGVWGIMPHAELVRLFSQGGDAGAVTQRVAESVDRIGFSRGGGHDNHSCMKDASALRYRLLLGVSGVLLVAGVVAAGGLLARCGGGGDKSASSSTTAYAISGGDAGRHTVNDDDSLTVADTPDRDTLQLIRQIEALERKQHQRDSLRADTAHRAVAKPEKESGKGQSSNGGTTKKTSPEQTIIEAIGTMRKKLTDIETRRMAKVADVVTKNKSDYNVVRKKMNVIKQQDIKNYGGVIDNIFKYVNRKDNIDYVGSAEAEAGYYVTSLRGKKVVTQIKKDINRLDRELQGTK